MNLPVLAAFEPERVCDERFGLLPDLIGLLGDELAFGIVAGLWLVGLVRTDSLGKGWLHAAVDTASTVPSD